MPLGSLLPLSLLRGLAGPRKTPTGTLCGRPGSPEHPQALTMSLKDCSMSSSSPGAADENELIRRKIRFWSPEPIAPRV